MLSYGYKNIYALENMFQVSTAEVVKRFKEKIEELDIIEQVTVIRTNTNVIIVCHYLSYHFGNNDTDLPNLSQAKNL